MNLKKAIPELGPLEFQLLRILWKQKPATAREVLERHNRGSEKNLKYTTVMTLLTRLVEKGVLAVDRERQPFQFEPRVSREQVLRQRVGDFVELFFDGRPMDLALRLVESGGLSSSEVEKLRESLQRSHSLDEDDHDKPGETDNE